MTIIRHRATAMAFGFAFILALAQSALAQGAPAVAAKAAVSGRDADFQRRRDLAHKAANPRALIKDSYDKPRWMRDGTRFVRWAGSGPSRGTWTIVDARRKSDHAVISSADLMTQVSALAGKEVKLPPFLKYFLSHDERRIVFGMAGRIYSLNLADGRVSDVAPDGLDAREFLGGKGAPDGRHVASADNGGIAVRSAAATIVERKGEDLYEWRLPEKPWSPDGRFLLASRLDQRAVHKIPLVDYSGPLETVKSHPYPKTGTPLPPADYHLIDVTTGQVRPVSDTGEEGYYFHAGWRPDSSAALLLFLSRDGKRLDLRAIDPATGASRRVLREENARTFVGDLNFLYLGAEKQVTPLADNKGFLWISERGGWRGLYLYDYAGKLRRQLTGANLVVEEVLGTTGRDAFFTASVDGAAPNDRHVFRVGLNGGKAVQLTRQPGFHEPSFSPTAAMFADSHSAPDRPRVSEVYAAGGQRILRYAEADVGGLLALGYKPPEKFTALAADGKTTLHGVIIKPYDFDPAKRYAVIDMVYNGPFTANVPSGYAGSGSSPMISDAIGNAFAQMGFIAVIVDPRGSPGRSKAFHDASYGKLGQIEIPDIVTAIRQAGATRPYMDLNRVGIFGHSYGGYYALRGMLTAPDFFKAGYAGASGSLMQESENHEANMDLITRNPVGYEEGSNERLAGNLKGALKMMHGTSDPLASLSSTMQMADALIKADKHFELLVMPGQGHNPPGPFNTYYLDDRLMFFTDHLGGPR